ncbi:MAG: hypothetical protein PHP88_10670 [bacterium]|nr:hypothetical protein [bacterium]
MSFRVKYYSIQLGRMTRPHLGTGADFSYNAAILCKPRAGGSDKYLHVFFLPDGQPLPDNYNLFTDATLTRYYAIMFASTGEYLHYIDILRNEKPIYAAISSDPKSNRLISGDEPAGVNEWRTENDNVNFVSNIVRNVKAKRPRQ